MTDLREFTEELLRFDTTGGNEADAQAWFRERLDEFGFETYEWTADADRLAEHSSFPDNPAEIRVADRPSVGGVLAFGDPDAGRTLVLNGHVDVVPAERGLWSSDPFDPTWVGDRGGKDDNGDGDGDRGGNGDGGGDNLRARGAADMKSGLAACVFAALALREGETEFDGRVVVESVAGEEEGGIGAAAAAFDNPYPFDRDAVLVAEPTELGVVTATEGSLMKRLYLTGRSAHAASRWVGESVLPHFERIRRAFEDLETERSESVTHPLYETLPIPWPVSFGTVRAGSWASTVPAELTAEVRIGVAPGETVDEVERAFEDRLAGVVEEREWLREHPPTFERFSIQFEAGETDSDEPIVRALQRGMEETGVDDIDPRGATYGADSRHYVAAGIPTVLFGPGTIEQAHFPNETVRWPEVEQARNTIAATARRYLSTSK